MGQRSQIYVKIESSKFPHMLIARYFQWNYGTRMISRARGIIEWLNEYRLNFSTLFTANGKEKLIRIIDTNFDYKDCVISQDIIKEYIDLGPRTKIKFSDYVFLDQDNNDGQLFILCKEDGSIKYAIVERPGGSVIKPLDYLKEYSEYSESKEKEYTDENIQYIESHCEPMTFDELQDFIQDDYSYFLESFSNLNDICFFKMSLAWEKILKSKKKYKGIVLSEYLSQYSEDEIAWQIKSWSKDYHPRWTDKKEDENNFEKYFIFIIKNEIDDIFELDPSEIIVKNANLLSKNGNKASISIEIVKTKKLLQTMLKNVESKTAARLYEQMVHSIDDFDVEIIVEAEKYYYGKKVNISSIKVDIINRIPCGTILPNTHHSIKISPWQQNVMKENFVNHIIFLF